MRYDDPIKQEMWDWFHDSFITPSECVPRMSGEHGYQYLCGGPYFADDSLQKEFGGKYPDDAIAQVVADLDKLDTEWARKKHYDYS